MKIYISGKVKGLSNYREIFKGAEEDLIKQGHIVINPAELPEGLDPTDYMKICIPMIDVCDAIFMLKNWINSEGAKVEHEYAKMQRKQIIYR